MTILVSSDPGSSAGGAGNPCGCIVDGFGTGVDGDATIVDEVHLTRDMQYRTLTIEPHARLYADGHRISVQHGPVVIKGLLSLAPKQVRHE